MLTKCEICIIGAGAAGLSVASGAAQLGINIILIEGNLMGGDCLNYGCVPSKSLLSIAKHYYQAKNSEKFGFKTVVSEANISNILEKVRQVIKEIEPNDSIERFTNLGVNVITGFATFVDRKTVIINNDHYIEADYFVIASGAKASIPNIPGLEKVNYLTNETIFSIKENPDHLIIIGGGPIGIEIAQAFAMLGVQVSLIARHNILPKEDSDLVDILRQQFKFQGINCHENVKVLKIDKIDNNIALSISNNNEEIIIKGSHLFLATGRSPNIKQLNLEAAGVNYTDFGIDVDNRLRTSNKKIFAIGDVTGGLEFTHVAGYHAGIIIRNILFRQRAKVDYRAVPRVTYTYPELAHVGLTFEKAKEQFGDGVKITVFEFADNDRARTEHETMGKIKLITNQKGIVLGVSILGLNAGELLMPWIDLMNRRESIKAFTKNIIPYPTLSEMNKQVVSKYYSPLLFSPLVRKIVKFLKLFW